MASGRRLGAFVSLALLCGLSLPGAAAGSAGESLDPPEELFNGLNSRQLDLVSPHIPSMMRLARESRDPQDFNDRFERYLQKSGVTGEDRKTVLDAAAIIAANLPKADPPQGRPGRVRPLPGVEPTNAGSIRRNVDRWEWNKHPDDPRATARVGMDFYSEKDYPQAEAFLGAALRRGDRDRDVLIAYGNSAWEAGRFEAAERAARQALELDAANKPAQILLGLARDRVSPADADPARIAGMTDFAGAGAGADPNAPSVSAAGRPAAAPAPAAASGEAAPTDVERSAALTREAADRLRIHDNSQALELASQAVDLNRQNAQAWTYRAIAEKRLHHYPDAVMDANSALSLAPGNVVALQVRSWSQSRQRNYGPALADANYSLEREPNAVAYYNRAYALAGLGQRDGALEALAQAARMDERYAPALSRALQLPKSADLALVFDEDLTTPAETPASRWRGRPGRVLRLAAFSASGGLLFALGFLHIFSAGWRKRVHATLRRALGSSPAVGEAEPAGAFWSQFEMVRPIGTGGMGVVYEARDKALDRRVAVKRMRDEVRVDPVERQRFIAEAKTVAALRHPNIVDIYSIAEDGAEVYLVFEFISGKTVADLVRQGPLSVEAALKILRGACRAVDYAHAHRVIHRDVKTSNIMVADDGRVKMMDFGVARQAKEALTRSGFTNTIAGTPPYMAPEQEQGAVRPESDVFGLSVCFYEMLTGALPFEGQGANLSLNKLNGRHTPPSRRARSCPAGLDAVLAKGLAPDPDQRYRAAGELLAAAEAVAAARAA